jgi:hypothetical protein
LLGLLNNYINNTSLLEYIFSILELEIVKEHSFQTFKNKLFYNEMNRMEIDPTEKDDICLARIHILL